MKQQLEKIHALLVRGVYAAAEHELEQLIADFDDTANECYALLAEREQINWKHPKLQALLSSNARKEIELSITEMMLDGDWDGEFHYPQQEYITSMHDKIAALLREREQMMRQEPIYQYHNSGNSWCDCNKNVYDAMKDKYRRIVYANPVHYQEPTK